MGRKEGRKRGRKKGRKEGKTVSCVAYAYGICIRFRSVLKEV
jgi:hypothetical protein